jgi:L-glyceraldehyde 3-phosphate reductase
LIGVSSTEQLDNNLACLANTQFTAAELDEIELILKG